MLRQLAVARIDVFALFLDDVGHAPVRDQARGDLHDQTTQVAQRPDDPDDHAGDGQVGAQCDLTAHGHERTHRHDQQRLSRTEDVGEGPVERVHDKQSFAQPVLLRVLILELVDLVLLTGEGLDDPHAAQILL